VPDALPDAASAVLAALGWQGGGRPPPSRDLLIKLRDAPREGPVRPEIWDRLARLAAR
jgi:acetoin utilization protein AcuC